MFKSRKKPAPRPTALEEFYAESRRAFGEQYLNMWDPSVLIAQKMLEDTVNRGMATPEEALLTLRDPGSFAKYILAAEQKYQEREDQRLHDRMANLERNTDWKAAAAISFGTGLVLAVAAPFFSTLLQPTADELFKRRPVPQTQITAQPQPIENTTNNNVYNFYSARSGNTQEKPKGKLACTNTTTAAYKSSLLELLERGDVVTLEVNGKSVSMCYRPKLQQVAQQHTLAK